jgi:predicted DNA-binding helix-hairpin-helix protein
MDTQEKLRILSEASKYDLACACSTNGTDHRQRANDGAWLYPVSLPGGGHSVMLKTLLSNTCVNDCKYCPWRNSVDTRRCMIGPDETAKMYMDYVYKKEVFGIFLSSAVSCTPDHSMANAVSINIETPGKNHFEKLTRKKDYIRDIIKPMQRISELTSKNERFLKVKTTTQFIVGASDECDAEIVKYTAGLYGRLGLDRVYFSSYQSGLGDKSIPGEQAVSIRRNDKFIREHRLYQVDFLLRKYEFTESDIIFDTGGNLSLEKDPKQMWAMRHPEFFPVNINRADKRTLLRIPGVGPQTAKRIINIRKEGKFRNVNELPFRGKRLENAARYLTF